MGRTCFICGYSTSKRVGDENLIRSMHRLPKHEKTRSLWLTACNLNEEEAEEYSPLYVCSSHFVLNDYIEPNAKNIGGRCLTLKFGAVPSLNTFGNPQHGTVKVSSMKTIPAKVLGSTVSDVAAKQCVAETPSSDLGSTVCDVTAKQCVTETPSSHLGSTISYVTAKQCVTETSSSSRSFLTPDVCSSESLEVQNPVVECDTSAVESITVTPKKRRFFEPRYVSEVNSDDFATPTKAERVLKLFRSEHEKKNKQVKRLQESYRYLCKRVDGLKEIVEVLLRRGLMCEEASDTLMIFISKITKKKKRRQVV